MPLYRIGTKRPAIMAVDDVRQTFPVVAERIIGARMRPSRIAVPACSRNRYFRTNYFAGGGGNCQGGNELLILRPSFEAASMRLQNRSTRAIGGNFIGSRRENLRKLLLKPFFCRQKAGGGVENNTGCQFVFVWQRFYSGGALFR
jgi:hypothetical protein